MSGGSSDKLANQAKEAKQAKFLDFLASFAFFASSAKKASHPVGGFSFESGNAMDVQVGSERYLVMS